MTIQLEQIETEVAISCACGHPAKLIALRHLLDACNSSFAETPDGSEVHPVCINCAHMLHASVAGDIEDRINALPDGWTLTCRTCSRPITAMHSILEWEVI